MKSLKIQQRKCSALTASHTNCLRRAISGSIFCRVHQRTKSYD